MRCLAWVAARAGLGDGDALVVDTGGGRRTVDARARRRRRGRRGRPSTWGRSPSSPPQIPLDAPSAVRSRGDVPRHARTAATPPASATRTSCCSSTIPRPRAVTQHGPHLEHDERFPNRTNVEFVARRPAPTRSTMRVWERGRRARRCRAAPARARRPRSRTGAASSATRVDVRRARRRPHGRARRHGPARRSGRARVRRRRRHRRARRGAAT